VKCDSEEYDVAMCQLGPTTQGQKEFVLMSLLFSVGIRLGLIFFFFETRLNFLIQLKRFKLFLATWIHVLSCCAVVFFKQVVAL
jgi:hypothetical protein